MTRRLLSVAALAILALGLLAGCDLFGSKAAIIGSIFIDTNLEPTNGGTEYHVWLYEAGTVVNPMSAGSVDSVEPVARVDGTFPGTMSDWYSTINYTITDVPAGTYFALVWIDWNTNDSFSRFDGDYFGFYDANTTGMGIWTQPSDPNVVVPATGLLDIDIWCRYDILG